MRADLFCDLLLTGQPSGYPHAAIDAIRAEVSIVIPALTLLGGSEEPATILGKGPIDLQDALHLAAEAPSLVRVITDPVTDLVLANAGDACSNCGDELTIQRADVLATRNEFHFDQILLALAETHHDDKGLTLPASAAPFQVYLMHIPGKELDTRAKAEEIYNTLQGAGISVLFDDRDERAGVKFNDADLIGCPFRVTVGEKNLKEGMVELKPRKEKENQVIAFDELISHLK